MNFSEKNKEKKLRKQNHNVNVLINGKMQMKVMKKGEKSKTKRNIDRTEEIGTEKRMEAPVEFECPAFRSRLRHDAHSPLPIDLITHTHRAPVNPYHIYALRSISRFTPSEIDRSTVRCTTLS